MNSQLTKDEEKLLEHSKKAVINYNRSHHKYGDLDTLYGFILSERGNFYDGMCLEPGIAHATVCGERAALCRMVMEEGYTGKIKSIIVADPVPSEQPHGRFPCGTCRNLINNFGTPKTTIILLQYIRNGEEYTFPKTEKFTITDLYPFDYEPPKNLWD